jgi:outer membrane protein
MMKYGRTLAALVCALAVSVPAAADKGEFGVRVRGLYMSVDSETSPNLDVSVEDRWIPEFDLSYWFTDNIAVELVLTYPQKHDVSLAGQGIGSVKQLPPTLMLQYHFLPKQTFQPYVGIGLNYTRFSSVNLLNGAVTMDKDSTGVAFQGGFDYRVSKSMYLNVDAKYVNIESDLFLGGSRVSTLKLDPWLVGVGIGWRF